MTTNDSRSLPAIGFLTVLENPQHGLFGGYLVLNSSGRPLEFHCTAPVKANRAQEILYGPTLPEYLYGEQIARTLLDKSQLTPRLVCTDVRPTMIVRQFTDVPVIWVMPEGRSAEIDNSAPDKLDGACAVATVTGSRVRSFSLGANSVAVGDCCENDRATVVDYWQQYGNGMDLSEPFDRIREAIEEARKR
jgi:hypothetical protein